MSKVPAWDPDWTLVITSVMQYYQIILFVSWMLMNFTFTMTVIKRNIGLIDIFWALGPFFMAVVSIIVVKPEFGSTAFLIMLATLLWGLRLGSYLFYRNWGKEEDFRYTELRKGWGKRQNLNAYFRVYGFQFILMQVVNLPLYLSITDERSPSILTYLGFSLFFLGWLLEAVADYQKNKFKKHSPNKVCTVGVYQYVRYPNYLGEISLWYGIALMAFSLSHWWVFVSPLILQILMITFTGIPFLEEKNKNNPDYQAYKKRVPRLIPFTKATK